MPSSLETKSITGKANGMTISPVPLQLSNADRFVAERLHGARFSPSWVNPGNEVR